MSAINNKLNTKFVQVNLINNYEREIMRKLNYYQQFYVCELEMLREVNSCMEYKTVVDTTYENYVSAWASTCRENIHSRVTLHQQKQIMTLH